MTEWTNEEVAIATLELSKAGLTAEQILDGGLRGALELAERAGHVDHD